MVDTLYPESLLKVLQSSLRIAFPLWSQTAKMAILTVITPVHCNTVTSKAYNFKKEVQQSDKTFMNSTWRWWREELPFNRKRLPTEPGSGKDGLSRSVGGYLAASRLIFYKYNTKVLQLVLQRSQFCLKTIIVLLMVAQFRIYARRSSFGGNSYIDLTSVCRQSGG